MSPISLTRRLRFCIPLAVLSVLIFAATASAQATVGTFLQQETVTFTDVSLCTGVTRTGTNTATDAGHFVDTGSTFHVSGMSTQDYRVDWSDGTYLISHSPSHFEFNTNSRVFV